MCRAVSFRSAMMSIEDAVSSRHRHVATFGVYRSSADHLSNRHASCCRAGFPGKMPSRIITRLTKWSSFGHVACGMGKRAIIVVMSTEDRCGTGLHHADCGAHVLSRLPSIRADSGLG
jgi:hypothetical protein